MLNSNKFQSFQGSLILIQIPSQIWKDSNEEICSLFQYLHAHILFEKFRAQKTIFWPVQIQIRLKNIWIIKETALCSGRAHRSVSPTPLLHLAKVTSLLPSPLLISLMPGAAPSPPRLSPSPAPAPIKPELPPLCFLFPTVVESSHRRLYFPCLPWLVATTLARRAPSPAEPQNGTPPTSRSYRIPSPSPETTARAASLTSAAMPTASPPLTSTWRFGEPLPLGTCPAHSPLLGDAYPPVSHAGCNTHAAPQLGPGRSQEALGKYRPSAVLHLIIFPFPI
jgi:hypothetical protein